MWPRACLLHSLLCWVPKRQLCSMAERPDTVLLYPWKALMRQGRGVACLGPKGHLILHVLQQVETLRPVGSQHVMSSLGLVCGASSDERSQSLEPGSPATATWDSGRATYLLCARFPFPEVVTRTVTYIIGLLSGLSRLAQAQGLERGPHTASAR